MRVGTIGAVAATSGAIAGSAVVASNVARDGWRGPTRSVPHVVRRGRFTAVSVWRLIVSGFG